MKTGTVTAALLSAALLAPAALRAEPYLAVRTGFKCGVCHVNPTGGGKRTEFGSTYSQTTLAAERLDLTTGKAVPAVGAGSEPAVWTGKLNDHLAIGSDLRANLQGTLVPNNPSTVAFCASFWGMPWFLRAPSRNWVNWNGTYSHTTL